MTTTIFANAGLFDGLSPDLKEAHHVAVEDGVIREVSDSPITLADAETIDLAGRTLMPGLIDAHVHCYFPDVDPRRGDQLPITLVAHRARKMLEDSLLRGFTTVRDTGGGDHGLYLAIERGWIRGPRLFYCGPALSQTGGHGDMRRPIDPELCTCGLLWSRPRGYRGHLTCTVDGVEPLREAVREEFRKGAHFIKIMGSGGVASTGDSLTNAQYAADEIRAVVDEVERHGSYVTAHVHPDGALRRAIELGVHCIEHGTMLSDDTAAFAASRNVSIVPTLAVIEALRLDGARLNFPAESMRKLAEVQPTALAGVEKMKRAGVRIGFGTDLIGEHDKHQCLEFTLRSEILTPFEILRSATSVNAEIIRQDHWIGRVAEGYAADLIVVEGNPLRDISILAADGRHVPLVMKGGAILKREGV